MIKVVPSQLFLLGNLHTTGIAVSTFVLLIPPSKMALGHPSLSLKGMFSKQ